MPYQYKKYIQKTDFLFSTHCCLHFSPTPEHGMEKKDLKTVIRDNTIELRQDINNKTQIFPFTYKTELWKKYRALFNAEYKEYLGTLHPTEQTILQKKSKNSGIKYSTKKEYTCYTAEEKAILHFRSTLCITFLSKILTKDNTYDIQDEIKESELFYILQIIMESQREHFFHSSTITVPIYLLGANVIYNALQGNDHIIVQDYEMLPTLILLLPILEEGTTVSLLIPPEVTWINYLWEFLQLTIPRVTWNRYMSHQYSHYPKDCILLGSVTFSTLRYLENLPKVHEGFLYTTWHFLSSDIFKRIRHTFIQTDAIRAIVQIPRIRRTGVVENPAAFILGNKKIANNIRMAQIPPSEAYGVNALDVQQALMLINSEQDIPVQSILLPTKDILITQGIKLLPSLYLAEKKICISTEQRLGQYAEVLRCQASRKKLEFACDNTNTPQIFTTDYTALREASLSELDATSSFLDYNAGKLVHVKYGPAQYKYLLRPNDILFAYRGSIVSIGKSGFVTETGDSTIPGQAMCIIRPLPKTDPVWLYYQLKTPQVQNWIRGQVIGGNALSINVATIKEIPLEPYKKSTAEKIASIHARMIEAFAVLKQKKAELTHCLSEVEQVLKKSPTALENLKD